MIEDLYILTDARGYTTACPACAEELEREISRVPLHAPIEIVRWRLERPDYTHAPEWRFVKMFSWGAARGA